MRAEIARRDLKLDLDNARAARNRHERAERGGLGYSLIDQTKVGVTIAPGAPVVGYDLLRRTKRIPRAPPEDSLDVATGEHRDYEIVPQRLLLAQRPVSLIQIYS